MSCGKQIFATYASSNSLPKSRLFAVKHEFTKILRGNFILVSTLQWKQFRRNPITSMNTTLTLDKYPCSMRNTNKDGINVGYVGNLTFDKMKYC